MKKFLLFLGLSGLFGAGAWACKGMPGYKCGGASQKQPAKAAAESRRGPDGKNRLPLKNPPEKTNQKQAKRPAKENAGSAYAGKNLCGSRSRGICKYELMTAACGELILKLDMPAPGAFPPSLTSLIDQIKRERGLVSAPDKKSGQLRVCYSLAAPALKRKKRQLEKHPAVLYGSYNLLMEAGGLKAPPWTAAQP